MAQEKTSARIKRRDEIIALREKGLTQKEIATTLGVSRQRVSQVLGKYSPHLADIITKDQCVYEGLRKWMNENRIYAVEMVRILHDGRYPGGQSLYVVYSRLKGKTQFKLSEINKLLDRSGLTYEELFRKGG